MLIVSIVTNQPFFFKNFLVSLTLTQYNTYVDYLHLSYAFFFFSFFCQIYSQPIFAVAEKWFSKKFPNSGFVNNFYTIKPPLLPGVRLNPLRLCFRTAFVVSTTGIAMLFPYFNQVLGVLGALNFWPLAIYFPVEMYFVQKKIGAWTRKWIVLRTFSFVCFLVTVVGLMGSIEGLISAKLG